MIDPVDSLIAELKANRINVFDQKDGHGMTDKDFAKVTRVEVIDENGRSYSKYKTSVYLQLQDDGRTLKAFLAPRKE